MMLYVHLLPLSILTGLALSCCPAGWIAGYSSCYFFSTKTAKWSDASNICRSMGGELVIINNAMENKLLEGVNKNFQSAFHNGFWIDGTDLTLEGNFVWASTQAGMDYTNWAPGEPNNLGTGEDCVEIYQTSANFTWNDGQCDSLMHFICERPQTLANGGSSEILG